MAEASVSREGIIQARQSLMAFMGDIDGISSWAGGAADGAYGAAMDDMDKLQGAINTAERELEKNEREYDQVLYDIDEKRGRIAQCEAEIASLDSEEDRARIAELDDEIKRLQGEIAALERRRRYLEDEIDGLKAYLGRAYDKLERLQRAVNAMEAATDACVSRCSAYEGKVDSEAGAKGNALSRCLALIDAYDSTLLG